MPVRILGALISCTAFWVVLRLAQKKRRRSKLPPGPPNWPFIGSILSWPTINERSRTFTEWRQIYGDLTYGDLLGSDVIVINSLSAAAALFEGKAANFSDRATLHFLCDLVGWGEMPLFLNYGPELVGHRRRMLQSVGTKRSIETLESTLRSTTLKCLRDVTKAPEKLEKHVRMLNGAVILDIAYGYEAKGDDDNFILLAEETVAEFSHAVPPGTFLVDAIPALNYLPGWFPGAGFKKVAASMIKSRERLLNEPYNFTIQELAAGRAKHSFTATHVTAGEISQERERLIKEGAVILYMAGSDTTVSSMMTFILRILLNPGVQKRAQDEIDQVIGHDRLPTLADRPHLPYVNACVKEALRVGPVVPEGVAHVARCDDEYNGYFIPQGTAMIPNVWGMAHDPTTYSDPFSFRPERFLGPDPEPDPTFVFGFGRRICPGRTLAQASMYIFAAYLLTLFDIKPALGPDGQELEAKVEYHGYSIITPRAFPFDCKSRSEKSAAMLAAIIDA